MLSWLITKSLQHPLIVLLATALVVAGGIAALQRLPLDAFPDTTPVMVQINTNAPALGPAEIEQQITAAVERAIGSLPRLRELRSISKFGLSQVTATFEDGTPIYFARQQIMERLQTVDLPAGIERPEMGPVSTGLGEIYHYIVTGAGHTLEELTTLHDWIIKPELMSVPGVAEVNTWGGYLRQYQVRIDPARLAKYALTMDDVIDALKQNNTTVGGGPIEAAGEQHLVQGIALTTTTDEIADIVVAAHEGVPVRIRELAEVAVGHQIRRGAVSADGEGEVVLGLALMLMGENSRAVTERLRARMAELRSALPTGVEVREVYLRTELIDQVLETVRTNLFEGALLVVAVLFIFLGNLRAGLIVALAIPLSMLFAFNGMLRFGIAASLMSLGAIDFGLIVDSSVISIENIARRLASAGNGRPPHDIIRDAAIEVRKPTMFGELIIMIVYLPILTLEGVEGKMFRPMALTVIFALLGSLVLSLTLMPVLASLLMGRARLRRDNLPVRALQAVYRPVVRFSIRRRLLVPLLALGLLAGGVGIALRLGAEFIPRLYEMAVVINTVRLAGVSLEESVRYGIRIEQVIKDAFPDEVRDVWTRTGMAQVATDPMGIEVSDVVITLRPRAQWKRARTQEELVNAMRVALEGMPGMRMIFSQPIEMRVNEMIAGVRADVGVRVFGDDLDILKSLAAQIDGVLRALPGSADVYTEQVTGQPMLEVRVDQQAVARYGVPAAHVLEMIEAVGGIAVGEVREGQRRFELAVRLAEPYRDDPRALERIVVTTASGERIPLTQLARIRHLDGPSTITREWQKRRVVVQCNVRGRDLAGFVADARRAIEAQVPFPPGYTMRFGGQFEHLQRAWARLTIVVPLALGLILALLYMSTGSVRDALLIFTGAPFAALGGLTMLWLRDMPFTISAGVGFVAVSGVAMLNGLVMISTLRRLRRDGMELRQAIETSALQRLRPVLMTALVAGLGFVPMMLNTGVGAEVQRPLASVVVGGVVSDLLLTLLVLPALMAAFDAGKPDANAAAE